jgi:protoporphyrinogen/coproporphyrinogen III oxidase
MSSIAIIGGGITGLTAAFQLARQHFPLTLYEADIRVGGVIQSVRENGYLAEFGPNTVLETSPKITALVADAGLEGRRLYSDPKADNRYLVRGRTTVRLPGSLLDFVRTPLFSPAAKARLLLEPFISRAPADREENLAEFVRRRIGQEFLDYAINPLVAGVYAGSPDRLSVKHAFPKLHALEQRYGSLILGQVLGARERKRRAEVSKQSARKLSFDHGLQVLTETLRSQLGKAVQLNSRVIGLRQQGEGWVLDIRNETGGQEQKHAAVIYTGPAYALPEIRFESAPSIDLGSFSKITYPPVASVVLGFRREDIDHPLDGFGMLVPEVEGFSILGTLFSSSLFPNRAPEGHVALTTYLGGMRAPELALGSVESQVSLTIRDLRTILGVRGQPTFQHCCLYPKAIPQYEVGYGRFKALMDDIEVKAPGFFLAGNYRDGISLGDSIVSGCQVAERVASAMNARKAEENMPAEAAQKHR